MNLQTCLALGLLLPDRMLTRFYFYGNVRTFGEAWEGSDEPRVQLLILIEALRCSQRSNGQLGLGPVVRVLLDLFPELGWVTASVLREAEEERLNRFLAACRDACDPAQKNMTDIRALFDDIFESSDGEFLHQKPGNPAAATLVPLLETVRDLASTMHRGRFWRITRAESDWEAVLKDLRKAAHLLDLYARATDGHIDCGLEHMARQIRNRGPYAQQIETQLRDRPTQDASGHYRCMVLFPEDKMPELNNSHATLHDPETGALLCRVREGGRLERVDGTLTAISTPIETVGGWVLYHLDTDRLVELRCRQRGNAPQMSDTDQELGRHLAHRVWE